MLQGRILRASGGVACLYRSVYTPSIRLVSQDTYGRYLWLQITASFLGLDQDLFVAVCYFAPHTSVFMDLGGDPFQALSDGVARLSLQGYILLAGDFNARTAARQTEFYADTLSLHPLDTSYARYS